MEGNRFLHRNFAAFCEEKNDPTGCEQAQQCSICEDSPARAAESQADLQRLVSTLKIAWQRLTPPARERIISAVDSEALPEQAVSATRKSLFE